MSALIVRSMAVSSIRKNIRAFEDLAQLTTEQCDHYRERLTIALAKFEGATDQLLEAAAEGSEEKRAHYELSGQMQGEVEDVIDRIVAFRANDRVRRSESQSTSSTSSRRSERRLEPIKIKTFDGQEKNWLPFRDQFVAIIHNDEDMDDASKLTRLRQYVDCEKVAALAGAYTGGYAEVWEELTQRYDNKRKLVLSHVGELTALPLNPPQSKKAIERVIDTCRTMIRAMQLLSYDTSSWDPLLYPLVVDRLPQVTRAHWHTLHRSDQVPNIKEMLVDLQEYSANIADTHQQATEPRKVWRSLAATGGERGVVCLWCSGGHKNADCPEFYDISLAERKDAVRDTRACRRCLLSGHYVRNCQSRKCCGSCGSQNHHELLCENRSTGGVPSVGGQVTARPQ